MQCPSMVSAIVFSRKSTSSFLLLWTILLTACGGGGGESGNASPDTAPAPSSRSLAATSASSVSSMISHSSVLANSSTSYGRISSASSAVLSSASQSSVAVSKSTSSPSSASSLASSLSSSSRSSLSSSSLSSSSSASSLAGCSPAITPTANSLTLRATGTTCSNLGYAEYVPANYASENNFPLIIALNGNGQTGTGNATDIQLIDDDGLPEQIKIGDWDDQKRFVVLAPQMNYLTRTGANVHNFIQFAKANYKIDPNRIYLTALSGGGGPFFQYLEQYAGGEVAAVIPMATLYSFSPSSALCSWKHVPAWLFWGENDGSANVNSHATAPYNGLKACSPAASVLPKLTVYTNVGHDSWTRTLDLSGMNTPVVTSRDSYNMNVYDWMLQYTRSTSGSAISPSASSIAATSSSSRSSSSSSSSSLASTKNDSDFGVLTLLDSYHPAMPDGREAQAEPASTAVSQQILGQTAMVLPPQNTAGQMKASYLAFVMGKNKGLIPGQDYVLEFDYPDDAPRQITFVNRGADLVRTVAIGKEFGDAREQYAYSNPESLPFPHTNQWQTYRFYFTLHDRFQPLAAVRNPVDTKRPMGPADGFWVAIGGFNPIGNPINEGAAVGQVRLYAVNNAASAKLLVNYPPNNLPRRRTFWREEMNDSTALCLRGDSVVNKDPNSAAYDDVGVCNPATGSSSGTTEATWFEYKMKLSNVLGFNVFTKDLLEFGFNQGFDIQRNGGSSWYVPGRLSYWDDVTIKAKNYGLEAMPYFEYYGSKGIGGAFTTTSCPGSTTDSEAGDAECRAALNNHRYACEKDFADSQFKCRIPSYGYQNNCQPLLRDKRNYTGFAWAETACIDVSDPDALVDAKKLINATVLDIKNNATFAGVWFRTRIGSWPISFREEARTRYASSRNVAVPTRAALRQSPSLRADYYSWWYDQRRTFLLALRDYIRNGKNGNDGIPNASVLFTSYHEEGLPVPSANYADTKVITDDTAPWSVINNDARWHYRYGAETRINWLANKRYDNMLSLMELPAETIFINGATAEYQNNSSGYATPPADPARYTNDSGVLMTMPFGKQFTLDDSALLDRFKNQSGMAMIHHFPLNEDDGHGDFDIDKADSDFNKWPMSGHFGYFVSDVERATPFTMLPEVRAVAEGDSFWLGYLSSNSFNTGAPQDMRRFNQAYLAWPAVSSAKVTTAVSDPEVVVRQIITASQGKFVAVFNTGMTAKTNIQIDFTKTGIGNVASVADRVTGVAVILNAGKLTTNLQVADFKVFYLAP